MEVELSTGWLSPSGEFIRCNSYDHISVAQEILENMNLSTSEYDYSENRRISADDILMKRGYVYIGISCFMFHEWRIGWNYHLTAEQIKFLEPYFEDQTPVNSVAEMRWNNELNT